jgi:hypothetical protein
MAKEIIEKLSIQIPPHLHQTSMGNDGKHFGNDLDTASGADV